MIARIALQILAGKSGRDGTVECIKFLTPVSTDHGVPARSRAGCRAFSKSGPLCIPVTDRRPLRTSQKLRFWPTSWCQATNPESEMVGFPLGSLLDDKQLIHAKPCLH